MSWSYSVPATIEADFDAAVDAAVPTGQPLDLPGMAEDVAASKDAIKLLAKRVKRPRVAGSAWGHCVTPDQVGGSDSVMASVWGND